MKKIKLLRTIAAALALCLILPALAACGAATAQPSNTNGATNANTDPITAVPLPAKLSETNVTQTSSGETATALSPTELYLHVGSPIALSDGVIMPLDKENPGVTALIHMNRTLVPLRFVSEFYGAKVSYDESTRTGLIEAGGRIAMFPVGENHFLLDGDRIELDTQTLLTGGRIMLPLRALCEQVLGLSVDYLEGVIQIAKEETGLTQEAGAEVKSKIGMYIKAGSIEALQRYFEENGNTHEYDYLRVEMGAVDDMPMEEAAQSDGERAPNTNAEFSGSPQPSQTPQAPGEVADSDKGLESDSPSGAAGGSDHSSTNTQVEGIDEADIIKTDGKYIYLLDANRVTIVDAEGDMKIVAVIEKNDVYPMDMYIDDGRLILIGSRWLDYAQVYGEQVMRNDGEKSSYRYYSNVQTVSVRVYDTSDMADIKLLRDFEIEGNMATTRKTGGYLYLLTSMYRYDYSIDLRPCVGENGEFEPMPIEDIMIAPGQYTDGFLTLSAINLLDADEAVSGETITVGGYSTTQYMSSNAMYVATSDYMYGDEISIAKFAISGGKIGYAGSGRVAGRLNNQFSLDEHRGYLRIATTHWDGVSKNDLFVLDSNMQICGSVKGFAPEERIYSVRFMGDRGYVVTFRETDPLFVFDLSDPADPKITGELKVPGFSTYLHPVSENTILGIGRDVYDIYTRDRYGVETVVGTRQGGIKLSLFDVSDMGKPKEIDTLILGDEGYAEALYNHKAAMYKASEELVAFCANLYDFRGDSFSGAFVISYAENKLTELGRIESGRVERMYEKQWVASDERVMSDDPEVEEYVEDYYAYGYYAERLVYIGDKLYYANSGNLRCFDLHTLDEIQTLSLWK
ncbi:MAG: beta-propeller domain-containing protein [Oscillospiraceae bacterium]|nr:beta-propeller domain-containing protein [Oscillospiraceae bacterium]